MFLQLAGPGAIHLRHLIAVTTIRLVRLKVRGVGGDGPPGSHCLPLRDGLAGASPLVVSARTSPRSVLRNKLRQVQTNDSLLGALRYLYFGRNSVRSVPRVARTLCLLARSNYSLLGITRRHVVN